MKIIADTNVLLRFFVDDDPAQSQAAKAALTKAGAVVVSQHALCELVWVLGRRYKFSKDQIADVIQALLDKENVVTDRGAVEAGLGLLKVGGDFADGVIAYEGSWLGGETFISFDKKAVALLKSQGQKARLLA